MPGCWHSAMVICKPYTGKTKEELAGELQGVIFRVPGQLEQDGTPHFVTADEYLSGNVRRKLRQAQRAAQQDPSFAVNVEALTAAQPKDLDASEIEVRLGATWIDKEYIQQFMYETFNTPFYLQRSIEVNYSSFTAEWQIKGKSSVSYNDVAAYTTYGTSRANAYKILEDSLNLRDVRIYDTIEDADGKERRVLNAKETTLAAQKQQAIREAFRDWIWRDPERRQTLVRQYNEEMNSTRPREYDGSHITFGGMNPAITLREHQKSAIAHVLYGGNTLLAHEVGAGKTFEMVAAAMEAKRLGLCQKSLFVVPNHLTEQWASEFLRLYPSANILVTTKKDFETHNRKKFCARIATGDYDAIIMGHSQFERIWAYNLETVLAEKLETIITRTTTNTRMRDFYDIYILEQLHGTTLNPKILHDALLATAHKRGSEKYLNQAEEVFDEVENDSVMQKLWEAYRKKFSYASDLEWDVIMKAIRRLYVLCEKGISL